MSKPKLCVVNPIPNTVSPCADWALLPQMLEPNVYGTCAPKDSIREDLYPRDTSFISFLNLTSICVETRSDIYDAIKLFTPELYVDLKIDNVQAAEPPPLPSPILKAILMKLVDKCTALEPILNTLDALIKEKEEKGSGSECGLENQWYIVTDLPETTSVVKCVEESKPEKSLYYKNKEDYCLVPRKVYTNCVTPPLPVETKDARHNVNIVYETF